MIIFVAAQRLWMKIFCSMLCVKQCEMRVTFNAPQVITFIWSCLGLEAPQQRSIQITYGGLERGKTKQLEFFLWQFIIFFWVSKLERIIPTNILFTYAFNIALMQKNLCCNFLIHSYFFNIHQKPGTRFYNPKYFIMGM